ncbi:MAG: hypothetical protein JNM75_01105 [Rhodospirillales bacterium]|nr:hypothetical protein [Rhodospirillales bacterium]
MFDQNDGAVSESDDQQIWRFLEFSQFVDLLDRKALFFARLDMLEDPFDGHADEDGLGLRSLPEEVMRLAEQAAAPPPKMGRLERWWSRKAQESEQDNLVNTIRNYRPPALVWANCWHAGGSGHVALWKGYRALGKLVAIRSTIGKLRAALAASPEPSISVEPVRYADEATLKTMDDPAKRALTKNNVLAHEREVRAILSRAASSGETCLGRGCNVAVDVGAMIDAVAVSPAAEPWLHELGRRVTRTYGLDASVAADDARPLALPDYTPERALPAS